MVESKSFTKVLIKFPYIIYVVAQIKEILAKVGELYYLLISIVI